MKRRKRFKRPKFHSEEIDQLAMANFNFMRDNLVPNLAEMSIKWAKAGKNECASYFNTLNLITSEVQRMDKENPTGPHEETDPRIIRLLDLGNQLTLAMDPLVRKQVRNDPKALADWDDIMQDFYKTLQENDNKSDT